MVSVQPTQSVIFLSPSCLLSLSALFNRDIFSRRHFLWKTLKVASGCGRMHPGALIRCLRFPFPRLDAASAKSSESLRFPQTRERVPKKMMEVESELVVTDRRRRGRRSPITKPKPRAEILEELQDDESPAEAPQVSNRRGKQDRRRQIDPTTCERDYSGAEVEFMRAMDDYKRKSGRPFPTWSEVLEVMLSLGYRKVAEPTQMEWRSTGD